MPKWQLRIGNGAVRWPGRHRRYDSRGPTIAKRPAGSSLDILHTHTQEFLIHCVAHLVKE
jgi:hypothetical protein